MTKLYINDQEQFDNNKNFNLLVNSLKNSLSSDWEIYCHPYLNGIRPDIVLMNENKGVHVIDVGIKPHNPVDRLDAFKSDIANLYCPRANEISKETIFISFADLSRPENEIHLNNVNRLDNFSIISNSDINEDGTIIFDRAIPLITTNDSNEFNSDMAQDLRGWLRISDFGLEFDDDETIHLDEKQQELVDERSKTGYRRIKGSAGSGKTLVLAHKAAKLITQGKKVLILTFNITLMNYIRLLILRAVRKYNTNKDIPDNLLQIYNYHDYVKNYLISIGHKHVWNNFWKGRGNQKPPDSTFKEDIPNAFLRYLDKYGPHESYYAILVDEGSDFVPEMWQGCMCLIEEGGEAYLVKDGAQDIYENEKSWTDDVMKEAGFRGRWNELERSYRMPYKYLPKIKNFIDMYLADDEDINHPLNDKRPDITADMLEDISTYWQQVHEDVNHDYCIKHLLRMMPLKEEFSYSNVIFLTLSRMDGIDIIENLKKKNIKVAHTFTKPDRSKKMQFSLLNEKIKATTVNSIKGFEGPMILLQIMPRSNLVSEAKQAKLVYTALTRLRLGMNSKAFISVVCSDPAFKSYGETWGENFYNETLN